ncbi:hypothetical protein [Paenibacillus sp. BC26]|uniref:hypothetical protein n=1 Tax=Paenibacillus sp. BC26 TaxID=1881032 RepID=UPI0008E25C33|nr:hypothetical protein [Paenibacillus sp. BC26]SFS76598.1 hypothetical protein SAMN05428962_2729 [Paenibacillus sp. BC26]
MLKKVLLALFCIGIIFATVAAIPVNQFLKFPGIRIFWQGNELKSNPGEPAIIMDGRTMLPVYLFNQAGFYAEKKGDKVEVIDKRTPYINTLQSLQTFNQMRIQRLDNISISITGILGQIELKDNEVTSNIDKLEVELKNIKTAIASEDHIISNLRTGLTDRPSAIYRTDIVCDNYIDALEQLKLFISSNDENQLKKFTEYNSSAINAFNLMKNDYNSLFNSAILKVYEMSPK